MAEHTKPDDVVDEEYVDEEEPIISLNKPVEIESGMQTASETGDISIEDKIDETEEITPEEARRVLYQIGSEEEEIIEHEE